MYSVTWKYKDRSGSFPNYGRFDTPEEGEKYALFNLAYPWFEGYYYYVVDSVGVVHKSNDPEEFKEQMPQTMFFTFKQNNNRGVYSSLYKYVIVEAESAEEANNHKDIPWCVYFEKHIGDCDCCGPRWTRVTDEDATEMPMINGIDIFDPSQEFTDGAFFICFKDNVVKNSLHGFGNQYVSTEYKTVAVTEQEKENKKRHAKKGQDRQKEEYKKLQEENKQKEKEQQEVKEVKLDEMSDKELKELGKKLKEQAKATKSKGWYEQQWD